ncbi:hypothetical protein VNO77_46232 [Canavalia gladiata]|uniref:Uncharacterized protein n=1 Tax=Canavalia gladiata TaxID=3824 RepID=A0AAN9JJ39_CANGL
MIESIRTIERLLMGLSLYVLQRCSFDVDFIFLFFFYPILILAFSYENHCSFSKPRPKLDSAHIFCLVILIQYERSSPSPI